jgi:hypothetical protein
MGELQEAGLGGSLASQFIGGGLGKGDNVNGGAAGFRKIGGGGTEEGANWFHTW